MKCPKCGFVQADRNNTCKKCGRDLAAFKARLGLSAGPVPKPTSPSKLDPDAARKAAQDRLALERSKLELERMKAKEAMLARQDASTISSEREKIEKERQALRSKRIEMEAQRELEFRRLQKEKERQEKLKLAHEKELLRLEQERLEAEEARKEQRRLEMERQAEMERLAREKEEIERRKLEEELEARRLEEEKLRIEREQKELEAQARAREIETKRIEIEKKDLDIKREQEYPEGDPSTQWEKGATAREISDRQEDSTEDFPPDFPERREPSEAVPEPEAERELRVDVVIVAKGGFFARFAAGLVDILFVVVGLAVFLGVGAMVFSLGMPTGKGLSLPAFLYLTMPVYILGVILSAGYFTYFHASYGQTPGKRIFGLKVVDLQGGELGYSISFLRFVAGTFSFLFCFMGYFWIGLDLNKQGWHDKLAQTVVVRI